MVRSSGTPPMYFERFAAKMSIAQQASSAECGHLTVKARSAKEPKVRPPLPVDSLIGRPRTAAPGRGGQIRFT